MKYEMIDLPEIAIIGKEGLCTKEKNAVQDLWQQVNSNFCDMDAFLERERRQWTCPACGGIICVHTGVCSGCGRQYNNSMNR